MTNGLKTRRARTIAALVAIVALSGWVAPGAAAAEQGKPPPPPVGTVFEVKAGDTFSAIAARVNDDPGAWRQLYDPKRSGLRNPHLVYAGSALELAQAADGRRYLRVVAQARPPSTPGEPAGAAAVPAQKTTAAPAVPAKAEPPATLTIGLLPNIGPEALLAQYEHLKRFLERQNPQKVRLVTSANFKEFFSTGMKGDFDIAVSAPHLARVMQLDGKLVPIAIYEPRIRALLVAPAEATVAVPEDVRGKVVAFANPQSLVGMYAVRWLGDQGLQAGKDYEIRAPRADLGVGRLLLSGEAVAAVMSNGEFRQLPKEETARLKIVREIAQIPNFVVLAHPRLGREYMNKIKAQLKSFIGDMEDGAPFAQATGVAAVVDVTESQLRELDPHIEQTRRAMSAGK